MSATTPSSTSYRSPSDVQRPRTLRAKRRRTVGVKRFVHRTRRLRLELLEDRRLLTTTLDLFPLEESFLGGELGPASLGDVNHDGQLDVVAVVSREHYDPGDDDQGTLSVLLGSGDGTFDSHVSYPLGGYACSLALGDLNGDGRLDVVLGTCSGTSPDNVGTLSVRMGNGDGTFGDATTYESTGSPLHMAIVDLDGDGALDVVTANSEELVDSGNVAVRLNYGDGTFGDPVLYVLDGSPSGLGLGDMNGDARLDVVVSTGDDYYHAEEPGSVIVLLGNEDGSLADGSVYVTDASINSLFLGDVNDDGNLDVLTSDWGQHAPHVYLGVGDGALAAPSSLDDFEDLWIIGLEDLDNDGAPDIAASSWSGDTIHVGLGNGTGAFVLNRSYSNLAARDFLCFGDLNGDGTTDVLLRGYGSVFTVPGNGDETLAVPYSFRTAATPQALALGDLNGDGILDIVTGNHVYGSDRTRGGVSVLLGNPDGTFFHHAVHSANSKPNSKL